MARTSRRPRAAGANAEPNFHGQKRTCETHAWPTDPNARLNRKGDGKATKLCFIGHGLMENRHGLLSRPTLDDAAAAALLLRYPPPPCLCGK